jgi:two-component system, chemotaxis family, protein-glutamate methylesterase/glutaminase
MEKSWLHRYGRKMSSSDERRPRRSRVLVVDDSDLMRDLLREIIEDTDDFRVIGEARTGLEAIRMLHNLNPDIVTLDIEMPDLNGLETLGYIMSEAPRPVVIVSSHTGAITSTAIRAYDFGALEIVPKPAGDERRELAILRQRVIESLTAASSAELRNLLPAAKLKRRVGRRTEAAHPDAPCAIAIAASTCSQRDRAPAVGRFPMRRPHCPTHAAHLHPGVCRPPR